MNMNPSGMDAEGDEVPDLPGANVPARAARKPNAAA